MAVKTSAPGHFQIPTAPAAGTSVTSGSANAYSAAYVQLIASTSAALYITGIFLNTSAVRAWTYCSVQLATGAGGAEAVIGQYLIAGQTQSTQVTAYRPIYPPIPVANATRIAVKTADSVGSLACLITLECLAQSNYVDDGVAVGTVTTVTTVTNQLTAAQIATGVWQDTTAGDFTTALSVGKSVMNGVSLGTGLTVAAVSGAVGSVTGAVGSVTGAVGSVTGAVGSVTGNVGGNVTGTVGSVVGAVGSVTGNVGGNVTGSVGSVVGAVGSVTGLTASNLDATISSRMATYTQPTGFLAATFPGTVASTTNITAGTLTTVTTATNLTNNNDKTGYALTAAYDLAKTAATQTSVDDLPTNAELATALGTADDAVLTQVALVKAQTDKLTFTTPNELDVNIHSVNNVAVTGTGAVDDEWGP